VFSFIAAIIPIPIALFLSMESIGEAPDRAINDYLPQFTETLSMPEKVCVIRVSAEIMPKCVANYLVVIIAN